MSSLFIDKMMAAVKQCSELKDLRLVKAFGGGEVPYPIDKPMACFCEGTADKMDFLLGYDEGLFGGESMVVYVLTDECLGGAYCEECAKKLCNALLELDGDRMITAVSAEKYMYDKVNFAYKVIMRFSLREQMTEV